MFCFLYFKSNFIKTITSFLFGDVIHKPHSFIYFNKWYIIQGIVCISKKLQNIVWWTTALIYVFPLNKSCSLQMKVRLVKPVKHDLSSCSSVFTPVSPISKTKILIGKILPDSGILPDNGIRYILRSCFFLKTQIWRN